MNTPRTALEEVTRTLRLKVKRESYAWLNAAAVEVNQVWNYCNETAALAWTRTDAKRTWLSAFDLMALSAGASDLFPHINADIIARVCGEFAAKRRQARRLKLRWRASTGAKRSLGWIPFRPKNIKRRGSGVRMCKKHFRLFVAARLEGTSWAQGCFAQDAVGDWWLCLPVGVPVTDIPARQAAIGIDLGLKDIAVTSDGDRLEAGRWTRIGADRLAQAQRRGHKQQAKRIHRSIARQRSDAMHKFSRKVVNEYQNIAIGDVSSSRLAKTGMAKSVLDSAWAKLKAQLLYKGQQAGRRVEVVDERYTTRACSGCGALTGPAGRTGLVVRHWTCADCGESHDRDVNAARNILRRAEIAASVCGNEVAAKAPSMTFGRP